MSGGVAVDGVGFVGKQYSNSQDNDEEEVMESGVGVGHSGVNHGLGGVDEVGGLGVGMESFDPTRLGPIPRVRKPSSKSGSGGGGGNGGVGGNLRDEERYEACIVWTPIPGLTWLCPFIGHLGISKTK